jgi:hypothetical protein
MGNWRTPARWAARVAGAMFVLSAGCSLFVDAAALSDEEGGPTIFDSGARLDAEGGIAAVDGSPDDVGTIMPSETSTPPGPDATDNGCADGEREGFQSLTKFPNIAGCAGGFRVAGVRNTLMPACGRAGGDDGANPSGNGCNVADLCATDWHVCKNAAEVSARAPTGCQESASDAGPPLFFVTRQSGAGAAACGDGANDLFGCGSLGAAVTSDTCVPLNRFSGDRCGSLVSPWACGADASAEADNVTKAGAAAGGAMCCRNTPP